MQSNRVMLDRCRSLATAAMESVSSPPARPPAIAPGRPATAAAIAPGRPRTSAVATAVDRPKPGAPAGPLSEAERCKLLHCPDRLVNAIDLVVTKLSAAPPASRRLVAGGASSPRRCGKQ